MKLVINGVFSPLSDSGIDCSIFVTSSSFACPSSFIINDSASPGLLVK